MFLSLIALLLTIVKTDFLESILGAGLLIYVSETWLSQVYREIRQQDILTPCGLSPLLLRTRRPIIYEEKTPRGSHLVRMISEYDGIGWVFAVSYLFYSHF